MTGGGERRRLLVVSDYGWATGGVEEFVRALLARAARRYDVRLLTWEPARMPVPPGVGQVVRTEFGDVRPAWAALDWAQTVVVVTSFNVRLLARVVAERPKGADDVVCVVQTSGHSDPGSRVVKLQERWLAELIRRSRATVAVSADVRDAVVALVPEAPVTVVENAARLSATGVRDRGRSVVGFVGRPHPQKGWPHFTRLARELSERGLTFVANTVSIPPAEMPPGMRVDWQRDDEQLLKFFSDCDVLVAPYLRADGLPLAILEALNCGVPVIGFDSPGLAGLLRRHDQPVVAPDYAALRDAVERWADGRLPLRPPVPGAVTGWDDQLERYFRIVDEG